MAIPKQVRRVGAIGDVHCQSRALSIALDFIRMKNVDAIFAVGDIADGGDGANRCCELLAAQDIVTVRGNHDRWAITRENTDQYMATRWSDLTAQAQAFLRSLRSTHAFETAHGYGLLCHALGDDDMAMIDPDDLSILPYVYGIHELLDRNSFVVHGHTHRAKVVRVKKTTFINVGTLVPENDPCFAVIDFDAQVMQLYEFDASLRVAPGRRLSIARPSKV